MKTILTLICMTATLGANAQFEKEPFYQKAIELAHRYIILDGHVDLPYRLQTRNFRLEREYLGIPIETTDGDFDYVRAKKGGLDAPFMSIFIPASYQEDANGGAVALADELIDMVVGIAEAHPDHFAIATSPTDIEANFTKGLISLPMGMENGAPMLTFDDVAHFYDRGIRYVTLTHAKNNHICDSSYDSERKWNGLSPYGKELIGEMNRMGIMVDVSHISDSTFYQVMELSTAPVIASHSSCRKFTPDFERNMNDDMIRRLGENAGVIQINFGSSFLDPEIQRLNEAYRDTLNTLLESQGLTRDSADAEPIIAAFRESHPKLYADVETVANHIDHVVGIAGIDHVGLGSDFDGVGDSLPTGLKDVSGYPNLIYVLLKRGYSDADIEKICSGNLLRVWREVEAIAGE